MLGQILAWHDAPRTIMETLAAERTSTVSVVGITGPVGAGKSHLSGVLRGSDGIHLATDDYLPDYDKVRYEDRDDPDRADSATLIANLQDLRAGRATSVPRWSFQSHSRIGYREVTPGRLILVEGIHALHERLLPHLDVCVFVEAPPDIRWKRWEHLEATGQRGWGVEVAREFFHSVAEPTFTKFAPIYKSRAHFIVRNEIGIPRA
ncbi:MAG: AAA family ATPase [Phycisphaeraceae bacterium]|nr:AAA family ATPase [Phycisphaeraceae bacterium]